MLPDVEQQLVDVQSFSQLPLPAIWAAHRDHAWLLGVPYVEVYTGAAEINSKWHYTTLPRERS